MKGDPVPDTDHILRYVGGSHVDVTEHGQPYLAGSGFIAKPKDHNRPSYNWLECMEGALEQQVQQVPRCHQTELPSPKASWPA